MAQENIWFEETTPFISAPELEQPEPELEETLSKKSRCKKKAIWEHFESIGPYKSRHTGAKCLYCLKTYKNAKPTNLENHIADIKTTYLRISNTQFATTTITSSTSTSNKRRRAQSSVISFYESSSIGIAKEERCTQHLFCIDFIKSLCPGYNPPGRNFLSTTLINTELTYAQVTIEEDLANEKNLTLEYIYSLMNLSKNTHTGEFIVQKIKEVLENIGPKKVSAIVLDNASNIVLAKNLITKEFSHIISIRCIAHHINLLTSNIMKLEFAKDTINKKIKEVLENIGPKKVSAIVLDNASNIVLAKNLITKEFSHIISIRCIAHHINLLTSNIMKLEFAKDTINKVSGEYLREETMANVNLSSLKLYVKTRLTTAYNCVNFILNFEFTLKTIVRESPAIINENIRKIIKNRIFFQNCEELKNILYLIKKVIKSLEYRSTTLIDCFLQLIYLLATINIILGIKEHYQRPIYESALEIWKKMGGGRHSSEILIAQMQSYSKFERPWDIKYIEGTYILKTWWTCAITKDNFIQVVTLKITSLTPHNLEIMSKLHSYYVTNAQTELKHMHCEEISENQIDNIIHSIQYNENEKLDKIEEFEDEKINETNETNKSNDSINNDLINFNNYFNFSSEQFCKVIEINVSVVIE
ncbi:hypothetical protein Glove_106g33 [Diversispora epigaea]|uniref:DUF659 domain-containing protein n=1 Tax=Diversispora epigaea TaxID=1348612 RepID=A0A397J6L8_9GLOM|nr:hypothetical protein Glove_106g33 [Diversispora epigaea]